MRVVFDFGGVLFRWRPAELLKRELPQRATDAAAAQHWADAIFQGYGGEWREFDLGTVEPVPLARRIAARTGLAAQEVMRVIEGVPAELQPIADSVALMARLRDAEQTMHFLSNMPAPYADHLEQTHDFVRWFESGVFSARVQLAKPDRAIFDHAAASFAVPPEDLVFLDDHPANVAAAREAGWRALHFTDAAACEAEMRLRGWWPQQAI